MQQVIRHQTKRTNDWVLTGTPFDEEQVPPQQSQSQKIAPTLEFFQQVRDENGRQRLHGAFKGGFSAGYFNSVGSKEGWTPSSFYSSRTKRARQEPRNQLEGLIDEEDVEDDDPIFSIGGFPLDIKPIFGCLLANHESQKGKRNQKMSEKSSTSLISEDFLQLSPESFSLGFQILRKLGWRDSRVIGEEGNVKSAPVVKVPGPELPAKRSRPQETWQIDSSRNEEDLSGIGYRTGQLSDWKESKRGTTQSLLFQTQPISYLEDDEDEYDIFDNQQEDYLDSIQEVVEKRAKATQKNVEDSDNSSRIDVLAGKLQFLAASRRTERKVFMPPKVPENYDTKFYPDSDKYAANTKAGVVQTSKRLLSSVKNAADRRVLLGESLLEVKGPTQKVESTNSTEQQIIDSTKAVTSGLSQDILDKLNKSMTERFTSSSEEKKESQETKAEVSSESKKPQGLAVGESKRQIQFWQPSKLLCKRFNVPQPMVTGETSKRSTSRIYTELPVFEAEKSVEQRHDTNEESQRNGTDNADMEEEETGLINSEFLRIRSERPSTELFRAIFEEDSEDEESETTETNKDSDNSLLYVPRDANATLQSKKSSGSKSKDFQRPRAVDYF